MVEMIVVDFPTRRRMRLNGRLRLPENGVPIVVANAVYSNCAKYIQQRVLRDARSSIHSDSLTSDSLSDEAMLIAGADTFGTVQAEAGADANHRGGAPGFEVTRHPSDEIRMEFTGPLHTMTFTRTSQLFYRQMIGPTGSFRSPISREQRVQCSGTSSQKAARS